MTLTELNNLPQPALADALSKCCGSTAWVESMVALFPITNAETLMNKATATWNGLNEADWREAFTHHPKIGGDVAALREKFASTSTWAEGEQAAVKVASQATLEALAAGNAEYEQKFGYIFIVCATGKTADEMLALLQARLPNKPEDEINIARGEQDKITRIRLEKLLAADVTRSLLPRAGNRLLPAPPRPFSGYQAIPCVTSVSCMSQITTHILDTTKGKPAAGVTIALLQQAGDNWQEIARGVTNKDGRIAELLPQQKQLELGVYKMKFFTKEYFAQDHTASFYPFVEIVFDVATTEHYHVPLLLNPFGYATYRGS